MRNQVFIPTVPKFGEKDVRGSWNIQRPLVDADYSPGLMVFTPGGVETVTDSDLIKTQYENLASVRAYSDQPIVTMLSNIPIEQMDWLHEIEEAKHHVIKGIDFARKLPIGGRKVLTFHLNTLMSKEEFNSETEETWKTIFKEWTAPELSNVYDYSKRQGVDVLVETCPAPEFGDNSPWDEANKGDVYRNTVFAELRNPFYLTNNSLVNFTDVRKTGLGICVDVCHNAVTYQTARDGDPEGFLHESDVSRIAQLNLMNDLRSLKDGDLVHLSDVRGKYSNADRTVFYEGIPLGEGEIYNLSEIVGYINEREIPFVLEVRDKDFAEREETGRSIDWILEHS